MDASICGLLIQKDYLNGLKLGRLFLCAIPLLVQINACRIIPYNDMTTLKHQIELETVSFVAIGVVAGFFLVNHSSGHQNQFNFHANSPLIAENPLPTLPPVQKDTVASEVSSDGTKRVIMKLTYNDDDTKTYTFLTA